MAAVLGLGNGAPEWLIARVSEIEPDQAFRNLSNDNSDRLLERVVGEVNVWMKGRGPAVIHRHLDCFEVFCGDGGITAELITRGYNARGFDRP
eukprot:6114700-Pyramimonas_sp.AAC.1